MRRLVFVTSLFVSSAFAFAAVVNVGAQAKTPPNAAKADPNSQSAIIDSATLSARIKWLQDRSIAIRSYAPADTDFADLVRVGTAIGDARVVLLGEQSHGDGTVFLLKTRLIKYLHEKLGFDVLAFESGLYDMTKAQEFVRSGESPPKAVRRGLFAIWSQSEQVQPLIDYIGVQNKSSRPLELAGFDSQLTASSSGEFWMKDLVDFLLRHAVDTTRIAGWAEARFMIDTLVKPPGYALTLPPPKRQQLLLTALDTIVRRVGVLAGVDSDVVFWKQNLRSIRTHAAFTFAQNPKMFNPTSGNARDEQMAENLLWLARTRYPTKKIIVWSASFHNMRNLQAIDLPAYEGLHTMGDIVAKALGNQVYSIGFVASQGSAAPWMGKPRTLPVPPRESMEGMWSATTHALAMIDLRRLPADGAWLQQQVLAGPFGYGIMPARWPQVMDAMIYTRIMEPSTRAMR